MLNLFLLLTVLTGALLIQGWNALTTGHRWKT